jgi:hypothetical protein
MEEYTQEEVLAYLEYLMAEDDDVVYPTLIFTSRYGGTYEGARWVALNEHVDFQHFNKVQGDDLACLEFFATYPYPVGKGTNPCAAYADLRRQLQENPEAKWPRNR